MPESRSRCSAGDVAVKAKGSRALLGAAMAIVGALAAALPPVITTCVALLAALSEPPKLARRE